MATVHIPTPLRRLTAGQSKVIIAGENISSLIHILEEQYPGIQDRLLDSEGNVKRFIGRRAVTLRCNT